MFNEAASKSCRGLNVIVESTTWELKTLIPCWRGSICFRESSENTQVLAELFETQLMWKCWHEMQLI